MKRKHTRIHSSSLPKKSSTLFYTKWSFIAAISILKSFYLLHKYYKCHTAVCTQPQVTFHYHKIKIFASKKVVLHIKLYSQNSIKVFTTIKKNRMSHVSLNISCHRSVIKSYKNYRTGIHT